MISIYHGHDVDLTSMRERFSLSQRGMSLTQISNIAGDLGFKTSALKANIEFLRTLDQPCILHWEGNHFVVLDKIVGDTAQVHDPARGAVSVPLKNIENFFDGVVLMVAPTSDFTKIVDKTPASLGRILPKITGIKRSLFQILLLAIGIESIALILPLQLQLAIDEVISVGDERLLAGSAIVLALAVCFYFILAVSRGWFGNWIGVSLGANWAVILLDHTIRLPLSFFERRHIGDITSKFSSINAIQFSLTGNLMEVALDGLVVLVVGFLLFNYSQFLTTIVVIIFLMTVATRAIAHPKTMRLSEEVIALEAKKSSELMESIRGVQTIRIANRMDNRVARFRKATLEFAERERRLQNYMTLFIAFNQSLTSLQRVLLITAGAYLVIQGKLTAGTIVAYIAYADIFTWKLARLIDKAAELRMMKVHIERVSDIAQREREAFAVNMEYSGENPEPYIELENVGFKYPGGNEWVFSGVSMRINDGESVALVGPSGCGKTTLAKIILGLLEPSEGRVTIGGIDIQTLGLERYRSYVAAVMQEDSLFGGSFAENIAFYDSDIDMEKVSRVATAVAIHDEISSMAMSYQTLVGDGGSSMSGGQRQRVLLARALYREPKIIVLDEATSNLDIECEKAVNRAISKLEITRLIIAHRPETIASADRVVRMDQYSHTAA